MNIPQQGPQVRWYRCSRCDMPFNILPATITDVAAHHSRRKHKGATVTLIPRDTENADETEVTPIT